MTEWSESALTEITVECYSGYRGEESPRKIHIREKEIEVAEELDRWLGTDHRYFKLLGSDKAVYIIRHDENKDLWELTFYSGTDLS